MITHLEPDILESKVKWALGHIMTDKASGGDGIPIKLLRVPKMMLLKCRIPYANKSRREQWPEDWKRSVFIPIPKKGSAKECSNYHIVVLILHIIKVMFKILQVRPQQYMNQECRDVQAGFRKGRETRDKLPTSIGSSNKQESSRKTYTSALWTMPKSLTV